MADEKQAPKKKGTAKTEAIIGTSVVKLDQAIASIDSATKLLGELFQEVDNSVSKVADKEDQLAQLIVDYAEKKRRLDIQLQLDHQEDETKLATAWLKARNLMAIEPTKYDEMLATMGDAEKDQADAVSKAVAIATNSLKSHEESVRRILTAEFNTKEAENRFKITALEQQLVAAKEESVRWQKALDDDRKAGIERAKASSVGAINIATPTGRN